MEEKFQYTPELVNPQIATIKGELLASIISSLEPEPLIDLADGRAVHDSLVKFTQSINSTQGEALLNKYRKRSKKGKPRDSALTEGGQVLIYANSHQLAHNRYIGRQHFYIDGVHAIGLGFCETQDDDDATSLALISFSCGRDIGQYASPLKNINVDRDLPVILQIQARQKLSGGRDIKKAEAILNSLYWERLLVDLTVDWAVMNRIPWIYSIPSELCNEKPTLPKYSSLDPEHEAIIKAKRLRFELRYDRTPQVSGFTMQENGLWGLNTGCCVP